MEYSGNLEMILGSSIKNLKAYKYSTAEIAALVAGVIGLNTDNRSFQMYSGNAEVLAFKSEVEAAVAAETAARAQAITDAETALKGGASPDYNTLKKLEDALAALNSTVADSAVTDDLTSRVGALEVLTGSNDFDLDTIQEVVDYIKNNRDTLENLTIAGIAGLQAALDLKFDIADIVQSVRVVGEAESGKVASEAAVAGAIQTIEGTIAALETSITSYVDGKVAELNAAIANKVDQSEYDNKQTSQDAQIGANANAISDMGMQEGSFTGSATSTDTTPAGDTVHVYEISAPTGKKFVDWNGPVGLERSSDGSKLQFRLGAALGTTVMKFTYQLGNV